MKKLSQKNKKAQTPLAETKSIQRIHFLKPENPPNFPKPKKLPFKPLSKKKNNPSYKNSHRSILKSSDLHEKYINQNQIILDQPEVNELRHLQEEYRNCLRADQSLSTNINWLIPKNLNVNSFITFADCVKQQDFGDLANLSINLLHFVCKKRIFRDQDFDFIYQALFTKFPQKQSEIKKIMIDVLSVLDS